MAKVIHFKDAPLTLVGRSLKNGMPAPDFRVVDQGLKEVSLAAFKGRVKIFTSFPSLDTPVCDLQVKEFNKKAAALSKDAAIVGISKDLPFAQARFCQDNNITNISVLSDYRYSSFGINYGLLIKELNLLGRSVIIADKNDVIRYIQIIDELTAPPDYDDVLNNLKDILQMPVSVVSKEELPPRCAPCEGGASPLPKEAVDRLLARAPGWQLVEDKRISKEFKFKDFVEAKYFLDMVSEVAQEQSHHPAMTIVYNKIKITLTTHAAGGLTENDFIMARIIDEMEV
ncbi:MAG: lipid hydroperoxide peroxidase [Omnitrophica bacterium RIFCSPLOWO2_01_FULL_45_24]|nr:MAG: lipid hydroperoxide peroxidase [Omnitrophica bacterium RIFCSPHIGHO2_02_FULL_46_20]OGW92747.1 MAG: lipid hydroperoxide peroxidase [Omnitrophica bacterium RIFCSPLOWO2_12_FULL_45_13]OGW92981.1 MAG: lipid hydroperoxide peroxidase [Omnitrophica bacterium RIFCSPLOWO2_01_FULL_45_24]